MRSQAVAWPLRNFNFNEHCFKKLTLSFEGRSEVVTVLDAVRLGPSPSANGNLSDYPFSVRHALRTALTYQGTSSRRSHPRETALCSGAGYGERTAVGHRRHHSPLKAPRRSPRSLRRGPQAPPLKRELRRKRRRKRHRRPVRPLLLPPRRRRRRHQHRPPAHPQLRHQRPRRPRAAPPAKGQPSPHLSLSLLRRLLFLLQTRS